MGPARTSLMLVAVFLLLGVGTTVSGLSPPWAQAQEAVQESAADTNGAAGFRSSSPVDVDSLLAESDSLHAGDTVVVVYWPGDSARAVRILQSIRAFQPLPALSPGVPAGVSLFLAPDERAMSTLTGSAVPEWGAGVAVPSEGRIVLPARGSERTRSWSEIRVLRHEWAHVGLQQHLGRTRIPRWFNEGYAEWASGGWDAGQAWRLRLAVASGRAPPLDSLTFAWPRDRASAEVAYMLAATAVEYLVRESGERGLALFLERWRESGRYEDALRRTYGVTSGQLEEDWKAYVKDRYGWLMVVSNSVVTWAVLASLLAVLFLIRRRRDRERLARLRAIEPPDQPAYWEPGYDPRGPGTASPPEGP